MDVIRIILNKIFTFFGTTIPVSVVVILLNHNGIFASRNSACLLLFASVAVIFLLNFFSLRSDFTSVINKKLYFVFNVTAFLVYFFVSLLAFEYLPSNIYVWFLAPTRFICHTAISISEEISFIAYFGVMFLCVMTAPILAPYDDFPPNVNPEENDRVL